MAWTFVVVISCAVSIFTFLGFGTFIYLVIRLFMWLNKKPDEPRRKIAYRSAEAAPPASRQSCVEKLRLCEHELKSARENGRISDAVYNEAVAYLLAAQRKLQPSPMADAGAPLAPPVPVIAAPKPRTLGDLQKAIAKLHDDAQAPEAEPERGAPLLPAGAPGEGAAVPPPGEAPPIPLLPAVSESERRAAAGAAVSAGAVPDVVAEPDSRPPAEPATPPKPLVERLFMPENVRILQSLGIGLVFISAVAFVRTQVWTEATPWMRIGLLIAGTGICLGLGFVLRRFTSLRIGGLGFLILGHLALLLDAYAALAPASDGGAAIYPWSGASLWFFMFLGFTASTWWHSRRFDEPLFCAFTLFGGLAAWLAGALALKTDEWLLPAAFAPALGLAGLLGARLRPAEGRMPRWSLPWWLESAWTMGSGLLVVAIAVAALASGRQRLAEHFPFHAAALLFLALGMLVEAGRRNSTSHAHAAGLLLLGLTPLGFHAFAWPLESFHLSLAAPAAILGLGALLLERRRWTGQEAILGPLSLWGAFGAGLGALLALIFELALREAPSQAAVSAGAALLLALVFALLKDALWGVWAATACAAILVFAASEAWRLPRSALGAGFLSLALLGRGAWDGLRNRLPVARHGALAAEVLAALGTVLLVRVSVAVAEGRGLLGAAPRTAGLELCAGWTALALYHLAVSFWRCDPRRHGAGAALLGPAIFCWFHRFVEGGGPAAWAAPAPWVAGAALACCAAGGLLRWSRFASPCAPGALAGGAALALQSLVLSLGLAEGGRFAEAAGALALATAAAAAATVSLRAIGRRDLATGGETAALLLLAGAGACLAEVLGVTPILRPAVWGLIAALLVLASLPAQALLGRVWPGQNPYRVAGEIAGLAVSGAAAIRQWSWPVLAGGPDHALRLTFAWALALLPLFLHIRANLRPRSAGGSSSEPPWTSYAPSWVGAILAVVFGVDAVFQALSCRFWETGTATGLRAASAAFFGVALVTGVAGSAWLRQPFAPALAMAGAVGLWGGIFGLWSKLPGTAFGLGCALMTVAAWALARRMRTSEEQANAPWRAKSAAVLHWAAACAAGIGCFHLLYFEFPAAGPWQGLGVAAWLLLAWSLWSNAKNGISTLVAGLMLTAAAVHALRWADLELNELGPGLSGAALLLLLLREWTAFLDAEETPDGEQSREGTADPTPASLPFRAGLLATRDSGILWAGCATAALGLLFGLGGFTWSLVRLGATVSDNCFWCATLLANALFLAFMAINVRRLLKSPPPWLTAGLELAAWLLLFAAVAPAAKAVEWTAGLADMLRGASWALVGALMLLLGMAGESLAGAILGAKRHLVPPTPFLETRHLAALGVCGWGALCSLLAPAAFIQGTGLPATWQAFFGAAAVAVYCSFSQWSVAPEWRRLGRSAGAAAAYLIFLPGGYLLLLKDFSTGSPWGALWFLVLLPLLLGAARLLEYEEEKEPATLALAGAGGVSLGALILAFALNRDALAEVPAATFAALAAAALILRLWKKRPVFTWLLLAMLTGASFFGLRAMAGEPVWGREPWAWEMPGLAAFGGLLVVLGGILRLETDGRRRSGVARWGTWVVLAAVAVSFVELAVFGRADRGLWAGNQSRLEALIVCLFVGSVASWCGWRWNKWAAGAISGPICLFLAYLAAVWRFDLVGEQWFEWASLPTAAGLLVWGELLARCRTPELAAEIRRGLVKVLFLLGSAAGALPSFILAMPESFEATIHYFVLLGAGLFLVLAALWARRKAPLLTGSGAMILATLIKAGQWAVQRKALLPIMGLVFGLAVVGLGCLFEQRMNRLVRQAVDRAKAQAKMFWSSWE